MTKGGKLSTGPMPNNVQVEMCILGTLMKRPDLYDVISDAVPPKAFFDPICREIYTIFSEEMNKGKIVDEKIMMSMLNEEERKTLRLCTDPATSRESFVTYVETIRELHIKREISSTASDALKILQEGTEDARSLLMQMQEQLDEIGETASTDAEESFGVIASRVFMAGLEAHENGGGAGLRTGIGALDSIVLPIRPGNFVIIAGRPAQGKTSLLLNILEYIAKSALAGETWAGPVAILTLEMPKEELMERMISAATSIPSSHIATGEFVNTKREREIQDYIAIMKEMPFFIHKPPSLSAANLYTVCKRLVRRHGVKAIGIDYIQLMDGDENKNSNERIGRISKMCKRVAVRLGIAIFALSQLSRKIEEREDKTPLPSDLRDSGSLEQDADVIIMTYWPKSYIQAKEPPLNSPNHAAWLLEKQNAGNEAYLTVVKQRRGTTGRARVTFDETRTQFR